MRIARFYFYQREELLYEALLRMGIERSLHSSRFFYCYGNRAVFKLIKFKFTSIITKSMKGQSTSIYNSAHGIVKSTNN